MMTLLVVSLVRRYVCECNVARVIVVLIYDGKSHNSQNLIVLQVLSKQQGSWRERARKNVG